MCGKGWNTHYTAGGVRGWERDDAYNMLKIKFNIISMHYVVCSRRSNVKTGEISALVRTRVAGPWNYVKVEITIIVIPKRKYLYTVSENARRAS